MNQYEFEGSNEGDWEEGGDLAWNESDWQVFLKNSDKEVARFIIKLKIKMIDLMLLQTLWAGIGMTGHHLTKLNWTKMIFH